MTENATDQRDTDQYVSPWLVKLRQDHGKHSANGLGPYPADCASCREACRKRDPYKPGNTWRIE